MLAVATTEPISEQEASLALDSSRALAELLGKSTGAPVKVFCEGASEPVLVPSSALRFLVEILSHIGQGNGIRLAPIRAELTTQQAADVLNVSRPYLISLLESGEIPFRKVGTRRRVLYNDVATYKTEIDAKRRKVLAEMVSRAEAMGEYDD